MDGLKEEMMERQRGRGIALLVLQEMENDDGMTTDLLVKFNNEVDPNILGHISRINKITKFCSK
jgi:hypothetical protein